MKTLQARFLMDMIKDIEGYIADDVYELTEWRTRTGMYRAPGCYDLDSHDWLDITLGDTWNCTYDLTRWFATTVTVPDQFEGKKVLLEIDFGGEILARIDGIAVGAFSSNMNEGWVHRDQILISRRLGGKSV